MRKLRVGVLGVGEMGQRHAEHIRRFVPEARLVAVADAAGERAGKVASLLEIEHSYSSLDELEAKEIDCILIATPDKFHASAIRAAAAAGKDILCEKPLATTLTDASAVLEPITKAGVGLQIGFMRRYDPAYAAAMKRLEAGDIGEPVIFKSIGPDNALE